MKKPISIFVMAILAMIVFNQNGNAQNCVFCNSNTVGDSSSAIGAQNTSTGKYSLASGFQNEATGDYSFAFGVNDTASNESSVAFGYQSAASGISSFATGYESKAYGDYSTAMGVGSISEGYRAVAIGFRAKAGFVNSFAFGKSVYAKNLNSFVIGTGPINEYLENNIENSLKIGFGSTKSTLFVSTATGTDKTGKIGIGDVTNPQAKLHIKSDFNEYASLYLECGNPNLDAKLFLGDMEHSIETRPGHDLKFLINADNNFIFKYGNMGIGTSDPIAKLQVNGNIFIEDQFAGLILKSPDGQCWKGTADNSGSFVLESVNCELITGEDKSQATQSQQLDIFPNPAGNKLNIRLPEDMQNARLALYNEQGVLLQKRDLHEANNSISIKKMPQGVLVVKVYDSKGTLLTTEKVMHQ